MPERLIGAVLKTVVRFRVPWVRIPPPPPFKKPAYSGFFVCILTSGLGIVYQDIWCESIMAQVKIRIIDIKDRNSSLINQLLSIWESSVKATHLFLSEDEIENIKKYVPQALKDIPHLIIAENENKIPIGFMGITEQHLEMLFISHEERGKGLGKALFKYGVEKYTINDLAVNEQNPLAKGFYEHMGFKVYKRTANDEQGNPYPLLYMKRL